MFMLIRRVAHVGPGYLYCHRQARERVSRHTRLPPPHFWLTHNSQSIVRARAET